MFSFGKARNTLERWLHPEDGAGTLSTHGGAAARAASPDESDPEQRVQQFLEELGASSQEWLGRVRMITFDSIRERVGPRWTKLRQRVEILAEKIIQDEMAHQDRYVNAGDAEFLVFFADATPEESRIRCLAIVEMIHEKLFGAEDNSNGPLPRMAECHVVHKNDLILEWETAPSDPDNDRGAITALGKAFRHDPETLDRADITASTQTVIGSIISRAADSKDASEFAPLLIRLRYLSRGLKALEPVLAASTTDDIGGRQEADADDSAASESFGTAEQPAVTALGTAWDDIVEVVALLDGDADSHEDVLEGLRKLQRARLERAMLGLADDKLGAGAQGTGLSPGQFGYIPIYRSVAQGERIHQGLYRITYRPEIESGQDGGDPTTRHRRRAVLERMILEHAIEYLLDRKTSRGFVLLAPVSVETLRSPNTQRQYSTVLRSAQLRAKRRLLIEVVGYSQSDHAIAMRRAIDELRLHSRAIFVTLSARGSKDIERMAAECKDLGAHAMGVDASQLAREGNTASTLPQLASVGVQHSMLTYVDGIHSVSVLAKAIALGIDYVCAPSLRPALPTPGDPQPATFDDLYLPI